MEGWLLLGPEKLGSSIIAFYNLPSPLKVACYRTGAFYYAPEARAR